MTNAEDKNPKTHSTYRWVKLVIIALAIIVGATWLWWQMTEQQSTLRLNGVLYHITVRRTAAELEEGLSGTTSLPQGDAMLFVFPQDGQLKMWMKDMNYPIDMVWLNDETQVVHVEKNVQPSTYDKTDPNRSKLFWSPVPARYVVEFPAGTVDKTHIQNGEPAGLPSGI